MDKPATTSASDCALNIGEVLLRRGDIYQHEIDAALVYMRAHDGVRLGEALVAIGACSQADVDAALVQQRELAQGTSRSKVATMNAIFNKGTAAAGVKSERVLGFAMPFFD